MFIIILILILLVSVFLLLNQNKIETYTNFSKSRCKTFCHDDDDANPDCFKSCSTCKKKDGIAFTCPSGKKVNTTINNGYGKLCGDGALKEDGVTKQKCTANYCCTETDSDSDDATSGSNTTTSSTGDPVPSPTGAPVTSPTGSPVPSPEPKSSTNKSKRRRRRRRRKLENRLDELNRERNEEIERNEQAYLDKINEQRPKGLSKDNVDTTITDEQNFMPNLQKLQSQDPYKPSRTYNHNEPSKIMAQESGWSFIPPYYWSVPQKRPPACIPQKGFEEEIKPVLDMGVPLNALKFTEGGSILPKFEYKEVYNPNYYYPGWKAK